MIRLGITGNIACGKTFIGSVLEDLGYPVIDSDKIVHTILATESEVSRKIVNLCKPHEITSTEATATFIDRKKLGAIFFSNIKLKKEIEQLIHPEVFRITKEFFEEQNKRGHKLAANLIPLLFETNSQKYFDCIWLIYCKTNIQKKRLQIRNPELSLTSVEERMNSQMSQELKKNLVNFVIDNSESMEKTKAQVKIALEKIISSSG